MIARAMLDAGIAELEKCPFVPKGISRASLGTLAGVIYVVMREHDSPSYVNSGWRKVPDESLLPPGSPVIPGTTIYAFNTEGTWIYELPHISPRSSSDG